MKRHQRRNLRPDNGERDQETRNGQILVMFATGILLLVGMVALAVDGGFIMAEKRQVQSAADAGAMAAAKAKLDYLADPGNSETAQVSAGKQYAADNAATSEDNVDVDTSPSPLGDEYVEVTVSKDVDMFFLRALYNGYWGVSATSVAGYEPVPLPYALVALNCAPNGQAGIHIDGSGTIDVNEGSIMSNCGIDRSGDSNIVTADGVIDAVGSINQGTQWSASEIRPNRPAITDPIASDDNVQPPTKQMALDQDGAVNVPEEDDIHDAISNLNNQLRCRADAVCVMQPGYYGGNMTVDIRNTGTLIMELGLYYFDEGFKLLGRGGAEIDGKDVMIYIDGNAQFDPDNATIYLSAPDGPAYPQGLDGMGLWIANCSDFNKKASNSGVIDGVIYAPCSTVTLSGSPGAQGMQVIVGNLELSGSGDFNILFEEFVEIEVPQIFLVQ